MKSQPSDKFRKEFWQIFSISLTQFNDMRLSAFSGSFSFDLTGFDQWLSDNDPEYDNKKCTYKSWSAYSASMYISAKFGSRALKMINYLNRSNFEKEYSGLSKA